MSIRRTITITKTNDKTLQKFRSVFLGLDNPIDLDYTTTLNIFIELGALVIGKIFVEQPISKEDAGVVILKYLSDESLKGASALDQFVDNLIKNQFVPSPTQQTIIKEEIDSKQEKKDSEKTLKYIS